MLLPIPRLTVVNQRRVRESKSLATRISIPELPEWAEPLLSPIPYKVVYSGRGAGKSYNFCDALLRIGHERRIKVLCVREFQSSIGDSVHSLLEQRIGELGLDGVYDVSKIYIEHKITGTRFLFKGIRHNTSNIKSIPGITHCWIEEAQSISKESWDILEPTIREDGSEIWISFNPENKDDIVYHEFVTNGYAYSEEEAYIYKTSWRENPHFPDNLNKKRLRKMETDPDAYEHIWEGAIWERSKAQIFAGKWEVRPFTPDSGWDGPYLGADFGFAQDPTALVMAWVGDDCLWIENESYAYALELERYKERWLRDVPECDRHIIMADSARPDTIDYLRRNGFPRIRGAKKGKGSVEDGIEKIRSFDKVIIHPRCKSTAEEFRLYRYKVDGLGEPTNKIEDADNHLIDGLRYALERLGSGHYTPPTGNHRRTGANARVFGSNTRMPRINF